MTTVNHIFDRPTLITTLSLLVVVPILSPAQSKNPPPTPLRVPQSLLLYDTHPSRVVETFSLIQQANAGTPAAQHELGYRYLIGRGVPADSQKAAEWILRAARSGMALAQYNAGILFTNAIGVEWNPFDAYRWFKAAALQELPAGEFVYGLLLTDGLVVPRDLAGAYSYVKHAHDQGFEQAKEALEEFKRRGFDTLMVRETKTPKAESDSSSGLVMLHFEDLADPSVGDTVLVQELEREVGPEEVPGRSSAQELNDSAQNAYIDQLDRLSGRGIPEAHMILGRLYERGLGTPRDVIVAAVHYTRAYRLDSPRALTSLSHLIDTDEFRNAIVKRAQDKDEDARYVWSVLTAIGFDELIGPEQALRFMREQSDGTSPHVHSCLELGFWYATGRIVERDALQAIAHWDRADSLGAQEGLTRIALMELILGRDGQTERTRYLKEEASDGSILAQAGYAFALEKGIGTAQDKPEAVTWYRKAAQRGSIAGYNGLKAMYDELRPPEEEFRVD